MQRNVENAMRVKEIVHTPTDYPASTQIYVNILINVITKLLRNLYIGILKETIIFTMGQFVISYYSGFVEA